MTANTTPLEAALKTKGALNKATALLTLQRDIHSEKTPGWMNNLWALGGSVAVIGAIVTSIAPFVGIPLLAVGLIAAGTAQAVETKRRAANKKAGEACKAEIEALHPTTVKRAYKALEQSFNKAKAVKHEHGHNCGHGHHHFGHHHH